MADKNKGTARNAKPGSARDCPQSTNKISNSLRNLEIGLPHGNGHLPYYSRNDKHPTYNSSQPKTLQAIRAPSSDPLRKDAAIKGRACTQLPMLLSPAFSFKNLSIDSTDGSGPRPAFPHKRASTAAADFLL